MLSWRRLLFAAIVLLTGAAALPSVRADIGASRDELKKRFGSGVEGGGMVLYAIDEKLAPAPTNDKAVYVVTVLFYNDHSVMEIYAHTKDAKGETAPLAADDLNRILAENAQGSSWQRTSNLPDGDFVWTRKDGKAAARYSVKDRVLTVRPVRR